MRSRSWRLVRLLLLGLACGAAAPVADIGGGRIAGVATPEATVEAFLGIPFAASPVGERRWRAPEPVRPWAGTRAADRFGASCMQPELTGNGPWTREFFAPPPFSEDCLFLNVWTPTPRVAPLPVLVWIHGGGFTQGGARAPIYDGSALAGRGVVVVTINYRVGLLGFFGHPELAREGPGGTSGNYGLLDQLAALRWVRDNIAQFGGDPAQVTIAGQSAGATSVLVLLASPLAGGLFHRAIAQSGLTLADPGHFIAQATLQENGSLWARRNGAADLAALRRLEPGRFLRDDPALRFGPAIDGTLVPAVPDGVADVPVLTGYNGAEGAGPLDATTTVEALARRFRALFGSRAEAALRVYGVTPFNVTQAAQRSGHDRVMMGAFLWASARARRARTPLYLYSFDRALPGPEAARWGAFHSAEIPFVFGALGGADRPVSALDRRVADIVMRYWLRFVRTGDPNGADLPEWRPFAPESLDVMHLDDTPAMRPVAEASQAEFLTRALLVAP